jgi:futalosine hydrolase
MATRVLIVFATTTEAEVLKRIPGIVPAGEDFHHGNTVIETLVTGVGGISTAWAMNKWLSNNSYPDLAINAGIAGSYSGNIMTGEVVIVETDCFADMGIESGEKFITLAEAGLMDPDMFPFEKGAIRSRNNFTESDLKQFRKVKAITVNTCSGSAETILKLRNKFNPDIETMEGATFFYICARENISFLGLRAISNLVEPRNRSSWNIPLALENLAEKIKELLLTLD